MPIQIINTGQVPDDSTGDKLRDAFVKVNQNFLYLDNLVATKASSDDLQSAVDTLNTSIASLQALLATKSDIGHTHIISNILGLQQALNEKVNLSTYNYAILNINQQISEINEAILGISGGEVIHNNLQGLNDGDYKHLTASQFIRVLDLIYLNSVSTLSTSPTSGEKGLATAVNVIYNIVSNDDIFTSATINQGIGSVLSNINAGTQTISAGNLTQTTAFTLTLNYLRQDVPTNETKTSTYTAYVPQWAGYSSATDYSTYVGVSTDLQKFIQSSATLQKSMSPTAQYIWFISNKNNATVLDANNFVQSVGTWGDGVSEFYSKPLSFTLADGTTTQTVYLYRSRQTKTLTNFIYKIQ